MHNFKLTFKMDITTKTKVPIFFQIYYPLVFKSEICLKYLLDFFTKAVIVERNIEHHRSQSPVNVQSFCLFLQFTNGFCLFSWFCFLLSLSSTELLHGMFMIPANTPQKVLTTSEKHGSSYLLESRNKSGVFFMVEPDRAEMCCLLVWNGSTF